ncbi:MAG: hypothetical protein HY069_02180 [Chlamydiia bacterium]|nr:hypothetical protein [Chlamydiia bacterium]
MNILSRLQNFVTICRYQTELTYNQEQEKNPLSLRDDGKTLQSMIRGPHYHHYYSFKKLNRDVQMLAPDSSIRRLWDAFAFAIAQPNNTPSIQDSFQKLKQELLPPCPELREFQDTDLRLYPHETAVEQLPRNGVRIEDFGTVYKLYLDFVQQLHFTEIDNPLLVHILRDIRMLLSRAIGRELIGSILARPFHLSLKKGPYFQHERTGVASIISYSLDPFRAYCTVPEVGVTNLYMLQFHSFAHEMIHMYHWLYGKQQDHTPFPQPFNVFANNEELLTMTGWCYTDRKDPLHDNAIAHAFDQPARAFHVTAAFHPELLVAIHLGARIDILRILTLENVPSALLDRAVECILGGLTRTEPAFILKILSLADQRPHNPNFAYLKAKYGHLSQLFHNPVNQ